MSTSLYELYLQRSGIKPGGTMLSYTPPDMVWVDATTLKIPSGRYYKVGSRSKNQYDLNDHRGDYWDLSSSIEFTVSGIALDDCAVNSNWYSVFMLGTGTFQILPFIRVYDVDYNVTHAGKTTIIPGDQNVGYWDTQVEETGYINSNDSWNGYRLRKWGNDLRFMFVSPVFTIEDTVNDTSDEIILDGDCVSYTPNPSWTRLDDGQCLQLIPPAGVPHLYLGSIWLDSSGNIRQFIKTGWDYSWANRWGHSANGATSAANTFISGIPPNAHKVKFGHYNAEEGTSSYGNYTRFYTGDSSSAWNDNLPTGNNTTQLINYYSYNTTYKRARQSLEFPITNNQCVRNEFRRYSGSWQPSTYAIIDVYGWSE